ncbi:MAG: hypothetical protein J2P49_05295 [Methylocapsa sp.]|nr:hypothetical protein [Methylocapsa sp.]
MRSQERLDNGSPDRWESWLRRPTVDSFFPECFVRVQPDANFGGGDLRRLLIDLELVKLDAFAAAEMAPHLFAPSVKMPVYMIRVLKDEWMRHPEDTQKTFDLLGSKETELFWIEGATKRFRDGYNYFGRDPENVIAILDRHMK